MGIVKEISQPAWLADKVSGHLCGGLTWGMKGSRPCEDPWRVQLSGGIANSKALGWEYLQHLRGRKKSRVTGVYTGVTRRSDLRAYSRCLTLIPIKPHQYLEPGDVWCEYFISQWFKIQKAVIDIKRVGAIYPYNHIKKYKRQNLVWLHF